ncbi:hypothetical protein KVT40_002362 [Elsinoe batatas]|uniref:Zn(2)-C6 fungal-type domain-containing protein n=1 Tax=Elsinoe batatas TaxID=2601811 RepID=A0A8K0LEI6_9PEZI|nr:hypothetical protein KVT40_002362 [Elsinoe batatas]
MSEAQIPGGALKRKRSSPSISSATAALPPQKTPKIATALQINYLARQQPQDLPLLNKGDTIPNIIDVLQSYTNVLDRHESLASNLGARPLGPILIKRFERCFESPPQIIASHSHAKDPGEVPQVTWLEVIQFAQSHPGQFTLSTFSEGRRVCQFYYPQKQVRVQVTEEDFLFIKSGRCQDLIPPLPIWEDEEKEVGTCEILEKQLRELTNAADTVAARTRQLSHRLKGRRMAIMERRAEQKQAATEGDVHDSVHDHASPDGNNNRMSGTGFTAVNGVAPSSSAPVNGESTAPVSVRHELLRHFQSLSQNQTSDSRRQSLVGASPARPPHPAPLPSQHHEPEPEPAQPPQQMPQRPDPLSYYLESPNPPPPVAAAHRGTPSQGPKHNFSRPLAPGQEMSQPFRNLCQAHMESLPRGSRVMPPCDRCRRLKMDCLKNLTSCQGCTKKHARCHWKEVGRDEIEGLEGFGVEGAMAAHSGGEGGNTSGGSIGGDAESDDGGALEDLEALGRDDDSEHEANAMRSVESGYHGHGNAHVEQDRGQVIAAAGGNSIVEAKDRARDVYRGGLPYSANGPVTSFREAGGSSPMSGPASAAIASTAAAPAITAPSYPPSQHHEKPSESRLQPFPPFEPPQQNQKPKDYASPRAGDADPSTLPISRTSTPVSAASPRANAPQEADHATNGFRDYHTATISADERQKRQQEAAAARDEAAKRREEDRAVSPFSATFARPPSAAGQPNGASGPRNPFEGASNGVSVGGGAASSSGWRGM